MTQPLFISADLAFEKLSSEVSVPEDPNGWPTEVIQELYKQAPYVADFDVHTVMERVDAERGFAFGFVEVGSKTEIQRGTSPEGMEAAGIHQARIPIIIRDRKLQPFDLVVTESSGVMPLTEARLRQVIFRPQPFDITARTPGDMSMIGQLYPPYRQNYGFGGGGAVMSTGMGKQGSAADAAKMFGRGAKRGVKEVVEGVRRGGGSAYDKGRAVGQAALPAAAGAALGAALRGRGKEKKSSLLSTILPTINEEDYNNFFSELGNKTLQAALIKNGHATSTALKTLGEHTPTSSAKMASAVLSSVVPTVVQIAKAEDGYTVKRASHHFWLPTTEAWDRGKVVRELGEKIALEADMHGSVTTTSAEGGESPQPEEDRYEMIKDFGIYKVKSADGKELVGFVFPNLLDTDGTPLPIFLFTNGSQAAVQGEICGIRAGEGASLFEGHPRGRGVFYEVLTNGKAQATIPLTITASMQGPEVNEGVTLNATTFDGRPVEVKVQENIQKIVPGNGVMCVPASMCWLPLDNAESVTLVGNPDEAQAMSKAASGLPFRTVQVRCGGPDSYSVSGFPVEKIAQESRSFMSIDDTLFLLAGLGANLDHAMNKLAEAYGVSAPVDVFVKNEICLPEEKIKQAEQAAREHLEALKVPARCFLLKEAAVIPDPVAVDTILSLGFLNPENVTTFVSYLPEIDDAQKKMCELLLATRLGLKDIPLSALEKSIRSTEEVLEGLRVMAFQKN